jgi:uncharacterized protein (TIGR03000 family)
VAEVDPSKLGGTNVFSVAKRRQDMTKRAAFAVLATSVAVLMMVAYAHAQSGSQTQSQSSGQQNVQQQGGYQGNPQGSDRMNYQQGGQGQYQGMGRQRGYGGGYGNPQAGGMMDQNQARIILRVPPDARVFFDNEPTRQMGPQRLFFSPPLQPGTKYFYNVRVTWMENGKEVHREKKVNIEPGAMATADFMGEGQGARYGSEDMMQRGDRTGEQGQFRNQEPGSRDLYKRESGEPQQRDNRGDLRNQNRRPTDTQRSQGFQAHEGTGQQISGRVLRTEDDHLVITADTGDQKTFRPSPDAHFTIDGEKGDLKALKPGMHITVTTKPDNPDVATRLEAKKGT